MTALKLSAERQDRDRIAADDAWQGTGLVFTTAYGTPYEPRNFARHFNVCRKKASVRSIKVHHCGAFCLVEPRGVEPLTSWLQTRRSAS